MNRFGAFSGCLCGYFFRINKCCFFFSSPSSTYFCSCFGVSKACVAVFLPYKNQTVFYSFAISTLHVKYPGILLTVPTAVNQFHHTEGKFQKHKNVACRMDNANHTDSSDLFKTSHSVNIPKNFKMFYMTNWNKTGTCHILHLYTL